MEPAIAGALYAAENVIDGAVALAMGIAHPTLPLRAHFTHITSTPLPRRNHTISVVKGRAYVFGGETEGTHLADNDMHIIILPSSGVLEADYKSVPARASATGGSVPGPRKGHSAVVIGDSIYVFGGEGAEDEKGRVWVYDTVSNTWSYLDPAESAKYPSHRFGHASASSELPGPKDTTFKERAPQKPIDPSKAVPEPAEDKSWGTVFVVGGKTVGDLHLCDDGFAFDVRSRTWSPIPPPSPSGKEGAGMALVGNRLYHFGGYGRSSEEDAELGGVESLDVSTVWKHAEDGTTALKSGWEWERIQSKEGPAPKERVCSGLVPVTTGQGRHYLLLVGGEAGQGEFMDDAWAFQLPPEGSSAASIKDVTRSAIKKDTKEGKWAEVTYRHVDAAGEEEKDVPGVSRTQAVGSRAFFASAKGTEVDGASVVVWGGSDERGNVLDDGWLITVDR